jgi:tight adherence protein B
MMRLRRTVAALLVALVAVGLGLPAFAQDTALELAVRDTRLEVDGTTEIVVNVLGEDLPDVLDASAFSVTEQGEPVADLAVEPFLQTAGADVVVTVAIDVSGSMQGEPMELTIDAASSLVQELAPMGVRIQVISFASSANVLTPHTDDLEVLLPAIEGLVAQGSTALYDAVVVAAAELAAVDAQRNLLVFSDGGDTGSDASLGEALDALTGVDVPATIVALDTFDLDPAALDSLASATDGRVLTAQEAAELEDVFGDVARDLASQYLLSYSSDRLVPAALDLEVSVSADGATETIAYTVPNVREQGAAAPIAPAILEPGGPGLFGSPIALYAVLAATFVALLLIFTLLFTSSRTVADRNLGAQLSRYIEGHDSRAGRSSEVAAHFRDRAMAAIENAPRPTGFDERLSKLLEQAYWPLRNSEFLVLSFLAGLATASVVGLLSNAFGGLLVGLIIAFIPTLIALNRREKRRSRFVGALPDTLQLMAGSLRAGYGILQSLDTVAKEAEPVVAEEFARVLTEARLGVPVETALELAADRIDNEDFRWVVLAINIQREVGGNLAELLDVVSEVLREREMLRRQVKVLSAEGRLSAIVLIALPIFLTVYLIVVRPEYIGVLVTSGFFGWAMVIGATFLMLVGVLWIRKLIQIEV